MRGLKRPPSYIQHCIVVCLATLFLGIFVEFFMVIFLICITMTVLNSVLMFQEDLKYRRRGILRYVDGGGKESQR